MGYCLRKNRHLRLIRVWKFLQNGRQPFALDKNWMRGEKLSKAREDISTDSQRESRKDFLFQLSIHKLRKCFCKLVSLAWKKMSRVRSLSLIINLEPHNDALIAHSSISSQPEPENFPSPSNPSLHVQIA